jgi:hypothetical protein
MCLIFITLVCCILAEQWFSFLSRCASVCFDCVKWRRMRDWCCCAKSLRDRLRRPICASLCRTSLCRTSFSSLSAVADVLIWLCQMAEKEGLVLLRKISSRPPAASHLRFAPSNFVLIPFRCRGCIDLALPNGGEGGIRTPGAISSTTDFESVTFGHSATSPEIEIEKRFKSTWQAWTENSYRSCFATHPILWSRCCSQRPLCHCRLPEVLPW